jgi:hypothetical protein
MFRRIGFFVKEHPRQFWAISFPFPEKKPFEEKCLAVKFFDLSLNVFDFL